MYIESHGPTRIDSLSPEPTLQDPVYINESELGTWTDIRSHARVNESMVGDYSYLMERVQLDYTTVGKFVSIAADARLGPRNHPITRPTAHHFSYRTSMFDLGTDDETVFEWRADQPTTIGHDVWIGHGATILPGVDIGNGAVVGAGAVVTDDISPYTVVAGVPAEIIRRRFPPETAARIESTEWWHWDHEMLSERIAAFRDLEVFLETYASSD